MLWQPTRGILQPNQHWRRPQTAAAAGFTFANLGTTVDSVDRTTYTFSAQSLGATAADRLILVGAALRATGTPTISSVSVDGVAATGVGSAAINDNASRTILRWWIADLSASSNTTGDIVVTMSGAGAVRCYIGWHRLTGASSTPFDSDNDIAEAGGGVLAVSTNVPAGGVCCGIACFGSAGGDETTAWSLATEHDDRRSESSNFSHASEEFASEQTGLTVSATCANADSNIGAMTTCSFGPA